LLAQAAEILLPDGDFSQHVGEGFEHSPAGFSWPAHLLTRQLQRLLADGALGGPV
jgi:hypothetical protein